MKWTVMLLSAIWLTKASFCQSANSEKLDLLMKAYQSVNKFNGTVLVAQKGKILLAKGYGSKDAKKNSANDVNSIFQIYSITKSFTSTLIMQLVEEKKLSLNDKLSKYYPDFPKGDSIDIEQLLSHTAGLYDYTRGNDMIDQTESSFIRFMQTKALDFSPGQGWSYSNSGYWMLGFIIAKVTGMRYEEAVHHYIFKPLKMGASGFGFKDLADTNKTTGYSIFTEKTKKESIIYEAPGPYAAGAIYSTVGDLYKFYQSLQQHSIVSTASLAKAYTALKNNYGYGWIIGDVEGKKIVSHSGGAAGYRSNFAMIPSEDICIILLNNNENANVELITRNILHIIFNKPYEIPYEIKVDEKTLDAYTGVYACKPFNFYVTKEDGRLMGQPSKRHKSVLMARKENYFFVEEAGAFIEFIKNEKGEYDAMLLHQGAERVEGKKIKATWGLLGTATTKEWDEKIPDIVFTEDSSRKSVWHLKDIVLKSGLILFRLNNDWGYHYGDNDNDKIVDMFGADIKVDAGVYDITLDLSKTFEPRYYIRRK